MKDLLDNWKWSTVDMTDVDLVILASKSAAVNAAPPSPVIVNMHIDLMLGKQNLTRVWCAINVASAFYSIQFVDA